MAARGHYIRAVFFLAYIYFSIQLSPLLGLDLYMPVPQNNPISPAKAALGRKLFSDPLLSRTRDVSCQSCHTPGLSFSDGRKLSQGIMLRNGRRNVPALVNRGYGSSFFWDGRASSLEEQVLQPIQNPDEMDLSLEELAARLSVDREYSKLFERTFGRNLAIEDVARALASYVRTIVSGNSPVDRYVNGDSEALSNESRRGLQIFRGKGNCTACHLGPNFSDERFHNTGVAWSDGAWLDDGRFAVTRIESDRGAFKVPTLREIDRTAPYMHDGSIATLEDVVEFYDRGANANPHLDREIRPLHLSTGEKAALVAFLKSLSGSVREGEY